MTIPVIQVMMVGGEPGLKPMTRTLTGQQSLAANAAGTFNFGEAQKDRYIVAAVAVIGLANNFGGVNINGVAADAMVVGGVLSNMRSVIYMLRVPTGLSGTIQVLGVASHVYCYRLTGMPEAGPVSLFGDGAGYVFAGGPPDPSGIHMSTGAHAIPANSVTMAVVADSSGASTPHNWGGVTIDGQVNVQSSCASRIDAVASSSAFSYQHQAAGAGTMVVLNVAGPPPP